MPSLHDRELLAKGEAFESQIGAEPKGSKMQGKRAKNYQHDGRKSRSRRLGKSSV